MTGRACLRERDVRQASSSGRWTADLRAHAHDCASCRETMVVASALAGDIAVPPRRMSPSILWAKARHARRRRAETAASRILVGTQVAFGLIGLALIAYAAGQIGAWSLVADSIGSSGITWPVAIAAVVTGGLGTASLRWLIRHS